MVTIESSSSLFVSGGSPAALLIASADPLAAGDVEDFMLSLFVEAVTTVSDRALAVGTNSFVTLASAVKDGRDNRFIC